MGSGGNYLSNEIFYPRGTPARERAPPLVPGEDSPLATGHFHLPYEDVNYNNPVGTAPGLLYSVRTAAERFLKYLYRLRAAEVAPSGVTVKSDFNFPRTDVNSTSPPVSIRLTNTTSRRSTSTPETSPGPSGYSSGRGRCDPAAGLHVSGHPVRLPADRAGRPPAGHEVVDGNGELLVKTT